MWSAVQSLVVELIWERSCSEMMAGSPKRLVLRSGTTKIVWVVVLSILVRVASNCPVAFRGSKESFRGWLQLNSKELLECLHVDNSDFCSSVQLEVDCLSFQK